MGDDSAPVDPAARAASSAPERFGVAGQFTFVEQYHPGFAATYDGPNSLSRGHSGKETADLTLFVGVRLWRGAELYLDPEVDQGYGLSNTLGAAGYPSGEAYKVGWNSPYLRLPRAFIRHTFDLGGAEQSLDAAPNQLSGMLTANNVVVTVGKFSVVDIFDTNTYAHDPRSDFLNWAIVDAGAFDYAADAWGFTWGATIERTQGNWTTRFGLFDLSKVPNSKDIDVGFHQFSAVGELERRFEIAGHPGKVKLLGFVNRGRMGRYDDAVSQAAPVRAIPDTAAVRHYAGRPGISLNAEQELTSTLGVFARASANDGSKEAFEFTEINRSISAGLSLKGNGWQRPRDTFGLAGVMNGMSGAARAYFAAGGLGILIGDGQLPHYGSERILETWYSLHVAEHVSTSLDYQYIANPAYNRDRGPVSIIAVRVHAEF